MWGWKLGERIFFVDATKGSQYFQFPIEGLIVKACVLISALVIDRLFPPKLLNMKFCTSIDWVARHMIEMCALEGEHLACINGETLDTSEKLYEQWHEHVWMLYDALSIHGGAWDNHSCLHSSSDVNSSASLHVDFHTLERLKRCSVWHGE